MQHLSHQLVIIKFTLKKPEFTPFHSSSQKIVGRHTLVKTVRMRLGLLSLLIFMWVSNGFAQNISRSPELNSTLDSVVKEIHAGDYTSAEQWLTKARAQLGNDLHTLDNFRFLYKEGSFYLSTWQLDKANLALLKCMELARASGDSSSLMKVNALMGHLKSEQGLYGSSLAYNQIAISYFNEPDSLPYYALLMNIAIPLAKTETQKSLQYVLAGKDFYERNNLYHELGLAYNNIGEIYREEFQEFDIAEMHYRKAMMINQKNGFNTGLAANYLNLALNFNESQQVDSSLKYIDLVLKLRESMGDVGGMAIVYNTLGVINLFNGNEEAAKDAFIQTVKISEEHAIYPGMYHGNRGLGQTYLKMGAHSMAKRYFKLSLQIAQSLNAESLIADSYTSLYEIEKEDGNFKDALYYFEKYSAYEDSLDKKESANEIAELKIRYETDLANKENIILKADKLSQKAELEQQRITTISLWVGIALILLLTSILFIGFIKRSKMLKKEAALHQKLQCQHETLHAQKEELKELNDFKNSILSVLGHDLRAPLTNISSLVDLINAGDIDQKEFAHLTRHLDQETKAGLISLQNILMWSQDKAENGKPQIENVSVSLVVDECLKSCQRQIEDKSLQISTEWDYARIISADKNQFKSIVLNLLTNAIKFSPVGGKIVLRTNKTSEGISFSVINAGEPISKHLIENISDGTKITSKYGTLGEKGTGIGLRIVSDFAKLHGGYLKLQPFENTGNEAIVFFPFRSTHIRAIA